MTLEELLQEGKEATSEVALAARAFVAAAAKFFEVLAANNIEVDFGEADTTENKIDYDAPVSDSYKKSYKPITAAEIVQANKEMSEAISGEKWVEGFVTCLKFVAMFAK